MLVQIGRKNFSKTSKLLEMNTQKESLPKLSEFAFIQEQANILNWTKKKKRKNEFICKI